MASKEDLNDVADSTDWLQTPLSSFSRVEHSLRCQICKNFFQTPMITSCAHTFCSLCIRRCLSNDAKCPVCKTQEQENKLRHNAAMEDVVEAFKHARPGALSYAKKLDSDVAGQIRSPKRKLSSVADEDEDVRPRKATRASKRRAATGAAVYDTTVVEEIESDGDYQEEELPKGVVNCPICNAQVKQDAINSHIDSGCHGFKYTAPSTPPRRSLRGARQASLGPVTRTSSQSLDPINRPKPLPQLHYSMFKETALRKKLTELGISPSGPKPLLEKRHTEWVNLWNSNCDASKPRNKRELLRELDVWERTQGSRAPSANNMGSQILRKDFDGKGWSETHGDSFRDLIKSARQSVAKKMEPPVDSSATVVGSASEEPTRDRASETYRPRSSGQYPQVPGEDMPGVEASDLSLSPVKEEEAEVEATPDEEMSHGTAKQAGDGVPVQGLELRGSQASDFSSPLKHVIRSSSFAGESGSEYIPS